MPDDWKLPRLAGAALAVLVPLGCGGDGGGMTEPDPPSLSVERVSGDGQSAGTSADVASPLVLRVRQDDGSLVVGKEVAWNVTESAGEGAQLLDPESETGPQGTASTGLSLGSVPGTYRVRASIPDGGSVEFSATAVQREFATLAVASGDGQAGQVGQELADSLVVRSLDQFGDPIEGVSVRFEISRGSSGAPSVAPASGVTDGTGRAATSLVLGDKNGTYGVRSVAEGDTVAFQATASGGTEYLLSLSDVSPSNLQAGADATLTGTGFSATAGENDVLVDGRRARIVSASDTELVVTVPTYEDRCLPRRTVDVRVVVSPDTSRAITRELTPAVTELQLAAGEDTVLTGPGEVGCVMLPGAAAGGAEYEVIVTPMDTAVGTSAMRLFVNGSAPPSSPDAAGPSAAMIARSVAPLQPGSEPGLQAWRRQQYEWDRELRRRELGWLPDIRARAARAPSMSRTVGISLAAAAAVGDTATFVTSCIPQGDVFAEVRATSDAAVIYEDTVMRSEGAGLTAAQYDSIATRFDTLSFAVDTTYFGAPKDIDGNGRVIMLFTPAVNRYDGNYDNGVIVGYFCGADLFGGNEAEMFYLLSPDPDGSFTSADDQTLSKALVRSIIEGTVIHEFQHLINAQIGGGSAPDRVSGGGAQDAWINEGLSHLAEEVGGHALAGYGPGSELTAAELTADSEAFQQFYGANFRNLEVYLSQPSSVEGLLSGPPVGFDTRGAAWSFVRYLLDRFMPPSSEHELTRALIRSADPSARGAVEDAVGAAAGQAGIGFEEIAADWSAAFAVEDRSDLAASPRPSLGFTSYRLRDVYGDSRFGSGGSYPLVPTEAALHAAGEVPAELFTGTARYVRLVSSQASWGTGLRLGTDGGGDLSDAVSPHVVVVRTK